MPPLKVLLLAGPTASGKTFMTERCLALEYDVLTTKMDAVYRDALTAAGVPRSAKGHSVYKEAHKLRDEHGPQIRARFWEELREQVAVALEQAHDWGVAAVFEGYTLRFSDEAALIEEEARRVAGSATVHRALVKPSLAAWNRNRAAKAPLAGAKLAEPAVERYHARKFKPLEPAPGVVDHEVADVEALRALAGNVGLRRHRWYQRFTFGPIATIGPSDAEEKVATVLARDLEGRSVADLACATGAHAIHAKQRGAARVVAVEKDTRRFAKAVELRKVVIRHSPYDARIDLRLGDVRELLPTLGRFDTVMFFGVIHYFEDYEAILAELASVTRDAMYVEFAFSEGDDDTADAQGTINAYTRPKSGTVIYMGDREAVETAIERAIPEFAVEERTLISPPGRSSRREIWRLRRREDELTAA